MNRPQGDSQPTGCPQGEAQRRQMGHEAIWCRPRTSIPDAGHRKYPYLLRELVIDCPDQVWCTDITCIPMPVGHAYLCAVMDWHSRKVLGWELSNTMDTGLCLAALEKALRSTGRVPGIFNCLRCAPPFGQPAAGCLPAVGSDQGSQFIPQEWTGRLSGLGVRISMDGAGRWMDNVFIERLWRSVKYECVYLHGNADLRTMGAELERWFERYNRWRPHQALGNLTPHQYYAEALQRQQERKESAGHGEAA